MPPPNEEKDTLNLGINTGVDAAIADFQRLGKEGSKSLKLIDKTTKAYGKTIKGGLIGGVKNLITAYQDYGKKVTRWNTAIAREQAKLATATADQREGIQKTIQKYKELRKERLKGMKDEHGKGAMDLIRGAGKVGKTGVKTGKGAWATSSALFRKDFKDAAANGAKTIATAMSSGKTLGKGMKKAGDTFWKHGVKRFGDASKKWSGGGIMGKAGAVKDAGIGAVSGAMGGIGKALGPLLKGIASMAPMLTMVAGAFGAIVKLMVDAEAQAKAMNKEILAVSGSSQQFYKYSQKGDVALQSMGDMLHDIRNDATSLDNIKWGIKKEDHMAVLTTLAQEGVALGALQDQMDSAGKHADLAATEAKSFGGAVHVAVAYSREFGVSLQEITQFQGEMMTEMGTSLADVETSFHMMTQGAAESGIATNKFFGIIRGISADLNLYNTRLEDAVHTLTLLGKVMSPRNAQKFMQFATQSLKGMSGMDRLRMNLMGGNKMGGINAKDQARKAKSTAREISSAGGAQGLSEKDIMDPTKKIADLLEGVADTSKGALTDTIIQLRMDAKANKKGSYGAASAAANASPVAALQMMKSALNIGGTGKLADRSGDLVTEQLAQLNGWGKEQLDQMAKFEISLDNQRDVLKKQLAKGGAEAAKAEKKLEKAGIKAADIDSASMDDIAETLDDDQADMRTDAQKEIAYAKDTSQYTSTISEKIEAVLDFLMNQLFNVMTSIWESIDSFFDFWPFKNNSEAHRLAKLQIQAAKTGNKELSNLTAKSTSTDDARHKILDSAASQKQTKGLYDGPAMVEDLTKKQGDLQRKLEATQDDNEKKKIAAQLALISQQKDAAIENANNLAKAVDEQLGGGNGFAGDRNGVRQAAFGEAAKVVRNDQGKDAVGSAQEELVKKLLGEGVSLRDAMTQAQLTDKEQAEILDKIRLSMSPEQLLAVAASASKMTDVTGAPASAQTATAPPPAPPPPPEPQQPSGAPPPAVAQAATADATQDTADAVGVAATQLANMSTTTDDIHHVLEQKGIKINKSFMRNEFWKQGQDAVLDATRQALVEYFLYSTTMSASDVAKGLKDGTFTTSTLGSKAASSAQATGKTTTNGGKDLGGFAAGGVIPEPKSPDSVFVAAKPGETITPAGGGGGGLTIPINVNGPGGQELAGMMKSAAMSVVAEWKRKHKYT